MPERRNALIVAIDRYEAPALSQLTAPAADAEALAGVLGDPALGGFDVEVLHNDTSSTITRRVEGLLQDRKPGDLVFLHFSCHGLKDENGELFLAGTNTDPTLLVSTAVEAAVINRLIRRSRAARVVLVLDCCYGGAFERGAIPRAAGDVDVGSQFPQGVLGGGRGRAIITASSAMEYAFEGTSLADVANPQPSVFTEALVQGIRTGEADRDQDGYVSLSELYEFVFERVRASTPHQTPCKWEFDLQGELHISRNPNRRIVPADLPADLRSLISSTMTAGRLGAVAELTHLAGGNDLHLAAAAHAALQQLSADDSQRVSTAAMQGLSRWAPRLPQRVVDVGSGRVGGPALTADLPLQGSPLAMISTVATSGTSVRAVLSAGTLRITALPEEEGPISGRVTLTGLAGDTAVDVMGSVAGPASEAQSAARSRVREQAAVTGRPHQRSLSATTDDGPPRHTAQLDETEQPPGDQGRRRELSRSDGLAPWRVRSAAAVVALLVLVGLAALLTGDDRGKVQGDGLLRFSVPVDGTAAFTDTGVDLDQGQQVTVTAEGSVFHNAQSATGPEGFPDRPDLLTPLRGANHNALIARIGSQGQPFVIGTSRSFTAETTGRLLLGINDGGLENNRGAYQALVVVQADP